MRSRKRQFSRPPASDFGRSPIQPKQWVLGALILVAVFSTYFPALRGETLWDDDAHITSPELRSLEGLRRIWTELGATPQYYPLLHSAFWLEHRLWGDSTLGYHLMNVLLHALSAGLLAMLLTRLSSPAPWFAAALFALHPVCVESVAWISEQKNALSTSLYLASALVYFGFQESRSRRSYWIASGLFVAALLSKSVTATLPAALLVLTWWRRRRIHWRMDALPLAPWFAASAAMGALTAWFERHYIGASGAEWSMAPIERVLVAGRAVWFYAGKLLWPFGLTFIYPRWQISATDPMQYLYPLALLALGTALWLFRERHPGVVAGLLLYVGTLFPALGFFNVYPFRYSFVADHFQYLAAISGLALVAGVLNHLSLPLGRATRMAFALALLAGCALLSHQYAATYQSAAGHYRHILHRNPASWMAYNNLGALLLDEDPREAVALLRRGVELAPTFPELHLNLANGLVRLGDDATAVQHFRQSLARQPDSWHALNNLGNALRRLGRPDEALPCFRRALELNPEASGTRTNLGAALIQLGRMEEALSVLSEAIRLEPQLAEAHGTLARALSRSNRFDEAIIQFEESLRLDPGSATVQNSYGDVLLHHGRIDEAIRRFLRAVELEPNFAAAHNNLGVALVTAGRLQEGRAHFESALRIQPGYERARQNLGRLLVDLERAQESPADDRSRPD